MAEEANARLFAARELGLIERQLDRSILDLSGDLAGAIREREERQREAERPKGIERTGPAVNIARFNVQKRQEAERREAERREAKAVARGQARIDRERLAARPIEEQAQAFERQQKILGAKRQERLGRIADHARARLRRREMAERVASAPRTPTGLLARFQQKAHEQAQAAYWREAEARQALTAQASALAHRLAEAAHSHACLRWAYGRLREAEPDLTRRVEAHRAKQEEQRRQAQADKMHAQELAKRLLTAAKLHQTGKLEQVEPALARVLGEVARMKGYEVLKQAELAKQLQAPAIRRAYIDMLKPHQQQIDRQLTRDQGPSR